MFATALADSTLILCREARMTGINYASQVGGLLGLCLGFSFLSAIELIYWFTYRLGTSLQPK